MKKAISLVLVLIFRGYQKIVSPFLMPSCRYVPSCSQFGIEAVQKHGPFKGAYLTLKRIISCNPWGGHGHDPVP